MSILIAWLLIGLITFVGVVAEITSKGTRFVRSDVWGIPACALIVTLGGPIIYAVWWCNGGRKSGGAL